LVVHENNGLKPEQGCKPNLGTKKKRKKKKKKKKFCFLYNIAFSFFQYEKKNALCEN
jgi:hypothetical protein